MSPYVAASCDSDEDIKQAPTHTCSPSLITVGQSLPEPFNGLEQLHPVIREFQELIENDADIYMSFNQMFEQVWLQPPYDKDPTGKPQIRDYVTMLRLFNEIIRKAPVFESNDFVGFPINTILDWPMATPAGYRAFTNTKVNAMFQKMFKVWAAFLVSPESCSVLTDTSNGWFGPAAMQAMPNFAETFVCKPSAPYYGFTSWDDFFTRVFRPGIRPVASTEDDSVITSACESTVYKIAYNIKKRDAFWLKGEPYSLSHMLDNDPLAKHFVGGTICQAFLHALNYHRWAAPVSGQVVKTVNIPGTYYAKSPIMGFIDGKGPDPNDPNLNQAFITSLATRALIFIEASNPSIGLMCFVAVGMGEVSTCEVTVKQGQEVKKGDELGMFRYGGSTHCLIFRPETKLQFHADYKVNAAVKLNVAIAQVVS
ncbi:L-tryptophan decarboxylase [Psilocybe cubensis]|uniref:L-tryptophan decarboxylase PsiD-like domain-containing protein n=2 Tax=Psilocybe cubensis TaxID=181762 RepID=A0A8H7XRN9_PSICU|nr:L-tryptophan decarboxylase [Psilocybe cubensis]KAH9477944.1 L-tryptophan decarboxylase [Psilocybe cubensis]